MKTWLILPTIALLFAATSGDALQLRVKDLAVVSDGGGHKLIGYGLVVGLQGTGDGKKAVFTVQALANMLEAFGLVVDPAQIEVDNVAAVIATAELPTHATEGAKLDVTVSSLGDAQSLQGGMLLLTPLRAADGQVYAIAQGAVSIGGYNAGSGNTNIRKNHSAVGRVPNGASIVKPISNSLATDRWLYLLLHQADFTTAQRLADSINARLPGVRAQATSAGSVQVEVPVDCPSVLELITRIENLSVEPDLPARVVINERTGTVVIGSQVRILPVVVAHGSLTVKTQREYQVSQPPPLVYESSNTVVQPQVAGSADGTAPVSVVAEADAAAAAHATHALPARGGTTVVVPKDSVQLAEERGYLVPVGGEAKLEDLVAALNALGVSPRDLIAIIQALKEAGALQAELIIQ